MKHSVTPAQIRRLIYHIRGTAVMIDADLATLYQVPTFRLNEAVRRNRKRFPQDFMFQLTKPEHERLRSQTAISERGRGGRRYLPYAFTEQGVAMLSCVLRSDIAIDVNIQIMRAFVELRRLGMTVVDLRRKIDSMERKYDRQFSVVFEALRELLRPTQHPERKRRIGFVPAEKG
jgi:hypothetical protein